MEWNGKIAGICSKETILALEGGCVATLGFFDGVHNGHRFLLDHLKRLSAERSLPSLVLSFWPHPHKVLGKPCLPLLSDFEEKKRLLKASGIDFVVILPFTLELSHLSARDFMRQVLDGIFHVKSLLMGYDHQFGRRGAVPERFEDYQRYGMELGIEIIHAGVESLGGNPIGSSRIREALLSHDVDLANRSLGYPYHFSGRVVSGFENGHRLGFPTANIQPDSPDKLIPGNGVYAVEVTVDGEGPYQGMLNIGCRPTLHNGDGRSIEVNIFDFSRDIYDSHVTVTFLFFLREEKTFNSLESLSEQLFKDKEQIIGLLRNPL